MKRNLTTFCLLLLLGSPCWSAEGEPGESQSAINPPEFFVPGWGAPWPRKPRVAFNQPTDHMPGTEYFLLFTVDDKPIESVPIQPWGGVDPYVHILSKELIAYKGCGRIMEHADGQKCDRIWQIFNITDQSVSPIRASGFVNEQPDSLANHSEPNFGKSYMGYALRFPNGNTGCMVYDWATKQYVAKWDSQSKFEIAVSFPEDATSVTCSQIIKREPMDNYGGDGPNWRPVFGAKFTQLLSSDKGSK